MSFSPRKHGKLNNPRNAAVSLDSFLGLLSSAYGTEQLDPSVIFEKDTVNWANISVDNLKAYQKKDDASVKTKNDKVKETAKVNASTSTTNLRSKNTDDETDETLHSIRSLVSLQQIKSKSDKTVVVDSQSLHPEAGDCDIAPETDLEIPQMDESNASGDNVKNQESCVSPVCGFYVDDNRHNIVFDIQFVKKASLVNEIMPMFPIGEPEISISISDTAKPMKSSAKVSKSSLVSKIKYFTDVDEEFGLENLDVVVRGNIGVFQWVLQWVTSDIPMCRPTLNVSNLRPILNMANHLGIQRLVQECLEFLHQNLKQVLESDREIEDVLDDKLLLDLTKRFSNCTIEQISSDFESFKTKLYCTFIKLLAEPEPCQKVGHFSSLSTMFQCGYCEKILQLDLIEDIPCRVDRTQLTLDGKIQYHHECSAFWSLTKYIEVMYEELKDWREVYWQLWGSCHFCFCEVCQTWYPIGQNDWCTYHPGEVEYFPMKNGLLYPIGTYGCCGGKTYKFDVVKPYGGCKHKSHVSKLDTLEKVEIFNIQQEFKQLINIPPPPDDQNIKKFIKLVKNDDLGVSDNEPPCGKLWWNGILLAPEEKKDYSLVPLQVLNIIRNRPEEKKEHKPHKPLKYGAHVPFGSIIPLKETPSENGLAEDFPSTSRQSHGNKKNRPKLTVKRGKSSSISLGPRKSKKKKSLSYVYQPVESVWTDQESNKDNQDNQRDFEEIAMRKLVQMLTPCDKTAAVQGSAAGSYIRLETEWWQRNCASNVDKTSSTVVNRTFPLSWFRRLTI